MTFERVIHLLQVEKDYTLKQTGFQQKPINKEVAEALDIAIEAVKSKIDIVRCKDCIYRYFDEDEGCMQCSQRGYWFVPKDDYFCSDGERRTDNENL